MSTIPTAKTDETVYDYGDRIALQRPCPDCDKGLVYEPVRFCTRCGGDGLLVRWVVPESKEPQ